MSGIFVLLLAWIGVCLAGRQKRLEDFESLGEVLEGGSSAATNSTPREDAEKSSADLAVVLAKMWGPRQNASVRYEIDYSRMLGKGSYGSVYMGRNIATDEALAIKEFSEEKLKEVASRKLLHLIEHEIKAQRHHRLWSENVVKLIDVYSTTKEEKPVLHLVMELVHGASTGRELSSHLEALQNSGGIPEHHVKSIFKQILKAVLFCHDRGIAHRDLKPSNVLLNEGTKDGRPHLVVKLIDFGLSCEANQTQTLRTGSPNYMAPQVVREETYDPREADYWSLGAMLFKIFEGRGPFSGASKEETFAAIQKGFNRHMFTKTPEGARNLITGLLSANPEERAHALRLDEREGWLSSNAEQQLIIEV